MIVGIGIDYVEIARIRRSLERFGQIFVQKVLHASEQLALPEDPLLPYFISRFAARFAAKEAAVKALGTGFAGGIGLHDIRVDSLSSGQPLLSFYDKAQERALFLEVGNIHVSLTHTRDHAAAVVVLESLPSSVSPRFQEKF